MPDGFKVATEEFRNGWNRMRRGGTHRLIVKMNAEGWNFIQMDEGEMRSGVAKSSDDAIASALSLALRRVGAESNAVEVKHVEITRYPWFVLATLTVNTYSMQQNATPVAHDPGAARRAVPRPALLASKTELPCPRLVRGMPVLKAMLLSGVDAMTAAA